ncbi:hypothetical protein HDU96_008350 [Phlyctochytrium bullatum]|nr:hypothetical protein HDU96_008350 [Phlyctochytrium bullatum]
MSFDRNAILDALNDDDDDKPSVPSDDLENFAMFRAAATQNPSDFNSYVFNVFSTKSKTRCDQFVKDTTNDCKKKLPGNQHCLSEVKRLSATCYNYVAAGQTTSILFTMPVVEIRSPDGAPLTKPEQCSGKPYYKVPLAWCNKLYGAPGLNDAATLKKCVKRVNELRTDCLNAVKNSASHSYPYFMPVSYSWGK